MNPRSSRVHSDHILISGFFSCLLFFCWEPSAITVGFLRKRDNAFQEATAVVINTENGEKLHAFHSDCYVHNGNKKQKKKEAKHFSWRVGSIFSAAETQNTVKAPWHSGYFLSALMLHQSQHHRLQTHTRGHSQPGTFNSRLDIKNKRQLNCSIDKSRVAWLAGWLTLFGSGLNTDISPNSSSPTLPAVLHSLSSFPPLPSGWEF